MNIFVMFCDKFLLPLLMSVGVISNICWGNFKSKAEVQHQDRNFELKRTFCLASFDLYYPWSATAYRPKCYELGWDWWLGSARKWPKLWTLMDFLQKMSTFICSGCYGGTQIMLVFPIKGEFIVMAYLKYWCTDSYMRHNLIRSYVFFLEFLLIRRISSVIQLLEEDRYLLFYWLLERGLHICPSF